MQNWREQAKVALSWLGLATLGSMLVLALELRLRAPNSVSLSPLLYLAVLASLGSLAGSAVVAAAHAPALIFPRSPMRAALAVWVLLGALALPAVLHMSSALMAGEWISKQSYVRALHAACVVVLWGGWQLLWLWHAVETSSAWRERLGLRLELRQLGTRVASLALALAGLVPLGVVFVALAGVLRPYAAIAENLLFPCWLVCATLAFRAYRWHRAAALRLAIAVLCACALPAWWQIAASDRLAGPRSAALAAGGFTSFADAFVSPQSEALVRLDFSRVQKGHCPKQRSEPSLPLSAPERRNVILISIDAMRRDALGKRFGTRAVAPHLESFERESLSFVRATAPAPITLLSLSSALTGRSLNQLLWQSAPPPSVFSLTRQLLPEQRIFVPPWSIFRGRGFTSQLTHGVRTHYITRKEDKADLFIDALEQARKQDRRGLFWMHIGEPHLPYSKHKGFELGTDAVARYYGEVAFADALVGRVLDYLRRSGRLQDSLVMIFADHGEALGERGGYFGHGTQLVGRFTDVPLIVHYPNVVPRQSTTPVVLTQIAPTILQYLDEPIPPLMAACSLLHPADDLAGCLPPISQLYGVSTDTFASVLAHPVRTLADAEHRQNQLIAWRRFAPSLAAITSDRRYVRDLRNGVEHLYGFPDGSSEGDDLVSSEPATLAQMRASVAKFRSDEAQRVACQLDER